MKWRHSIVYLVVLLLVGGYFYYFEVVGRERKEAAEKEAKKIFHVQSADIQSIRIDSREKKSVQLKKEAQWQIVEPVRADVDQAPLQDLLSAVSGLEATREVASSAEDLKPYGLQEPAFKVRFEVSGQSMELRAGDKNPAGDGRYVQIAGKPAVFLIPEGQWTLLAKGLDELRRKDLFTFKTDEVTGLGIAWQNGGTLNVEKQPEGSGWKSPENPDVRIKPGKVNNVLDQVHFLRAQSFIEDAPGDLPQLGLAPPLATMTIRLKDGTSAELRLGRTDKDAQQLTALSSQLPAAVQVDSRVLQGLPENIQALEDRSLLSLNRDEIKKVRWQFGEASGEVVQKSSDNWDVKRGDGEPQPLKESWRVKSLLWDLNDFEYLTRPNPSPPPPEKPFARLELWTDDKLVASFAWDQPQAGDMKPQSLWMMHSIGPEAVQVDEKVIDTLHKDIGQLLHSEAPRQQ
ncbi:MAG: DUF4340 domain-containing protein [Syntrophobacteraceae bacterium]|nr:DUF4340 domain-containing protein [Desulfobacteraceae bacterium]